MEYPDLSKADMIAIDIETYDPNLQKYGAGVYRKDGFILGVSIATSNFAEYYNLGHYDCNEKEREANVAYIRKVIQLPIPKVGANLLYDVDWLTNWLEFNPTDFKRRSIHTEVVGPWYDIQVVEPLIDEHQKSFSLDTIANKYLGRGKHKTEVERFAEEQGWTGDVRQYLHRMPYKVVRAYAIEDAKEPLEIFKAQYKIMEDTGLLTVFNLETELLPAVLSMRNTGAIVDEAKRKENADATRKRLAESKQRIKERYGDVNYNSSLQLARLFDKTNIPYEWLLTYTDRTGQRVQTRIGYEEGKAVKRIMAGRGDDNDRRLADSVTGHYSEAIHLCNPTIPAEYLESIETEDEVVSDVLFCRKAEKALNTFLEGSLKEHVARDGRIHPTINTVKGDDQYGGLLGTVTGRFSMKSPNLQQIPYRDKIWGPLCRECFIAEKGYWFVSIDYSQVEYRILAHYAQGSGAIHLRETYNNDPDTDYHQYIQDMTNLERPHAKNLNFGCMYGMGITTMMHNFGWDREFCEEVNSVYHSNAPYVKATMRRVAEVAKRRGYVRTIGGRHAHMESEDKLYKMLNKLIQGSAADIMKRAMVNIYKSGVLDILRWHITVHDELIFSVPKTVEGVLALREVKRMMENAYPLLVPIKAEIAIGDNWHDARLLEFEFPISRGKFNRLADNLKGDWSHNWENIQGNWVDRLTERNVEEMVAFYTMISEDLKQAKRSK
jgi:DNA polymerase I-like protein with 3'-5' exonuclease and polymerase domains